MHLIVTLRLIYCYAECRYDDCRYAECRYDECRYAECRYAECRGALRYLVSRVEGNGLKKHIKAKYFTNRIRPVQLQLLGHRHFYQLLATFFY